MNSLLTKVEIDEIEMQTGKEYKNYPEQNYTNNPKVTTVTGIYSYLCLIFSFLSRLYIYIYILPLETMNSLLKTKKSYFIIY